MRGWLKKQDRADFSANRRLIYNINQPLNISIECTAGCFVAIAQCLTGEELACLEFMCTAFLTTEGEPPDYARTVYENIYMKFFRTN